ncbi:MAG: sulfotransferase [Streptomycetaceae bacterium]|nr:sulfotransferase [Streptomycetaceae bacterium]
MADGGRFELYPRPAWVRHVNAMGDAAGGAERLVPLDVDAMCQTAVDSTGLSDFGDLDGDWLTRLKALTAAIDDSANMHALGRLMTRAEMIRCLRTRLWVTEDRRRRPGVADERITAPILVTGPARSGTSLLLELLDLDPALRGPSGWEIADPGVVGGGSREERIHRAAGEYELWGDVQPEFLAIHDFKAVYPQECIHVQMPSFSGMYWRMAADIPTWAPDPMAAMKFHRAVLQALQHGQDPATWVLKTPVYLGTLDLVFALYPDAWVIHNHRDPVKTTVSGASTLATVRWIRSDHVDPAAVGSDDGMCPIMLNVMRRRVAGELPDRIVDVHFADLLADPAGAVERAYATMGREFTGAHADAIRHYVANRPQGALGAHSYTAEQFGIDKAALRERMRPYTDHYGIRLE